MATEDELIAERISKFKPGYRLDLERREELVATATKLVLRAPKAPPPIIDPSSWLRVEDQLNQGSCTGQAITSIGEYCYWVQSGGTILQFSRQYSYVRGQEADNLVGRDNGATISGSVAGAKKYGMCLEDLAPYTGKYYTKFSAAADGDAATRKIQHHVPMRSYADCFNFVALGLGGIEFGIIIRSSYMNIGSSGLVESMTGSHVGPGGQPAGHALSWVGYLEKRDTQGRQYLWGPGSWGKGWGRNGWGLYSPTLIDRWCKDGQSEVHGVSDMTVMEERPFDWLNEGPNI